MTRSILSACLVLALAHLGCGARSELGDERPARRQAPPSPSPSPSCPRVEGSAAPGKALWSASFGAPFVAVDGVATNELGEIAISGTFEGTLDLGIGSINATPDHRDAFVAKLDTNGCLQWVRALGELLHVASASTSVAIDPSGRVTLGQTAGTDKFSLTHGFVVTYGPTGDVLAALPLDGGAWATVTSVTMDAAGGVFAVGGASGSNVLGPTGGYNGPPDGAPYGKGGAWIATPVGTGSFWGDASWIEPLDIAVRGGAAVVAGRFHGSVDFPLPTTTISSTEGGDDAFLYAFDSSSKWWYGPGAAKDGWKTNWAAPSGGFHVAIDPAGNVVSAGGAASACSPGTQPIVSRYDPKGKLLWRKCSPTLGQELPPDVGVDNAGDIVIAGRFMGTLELGGAPLSDTSDAAVFVASIESGGALRWAEAPFAAQGPVAIAVEPSGDSILVSGFQGKIDLGNGPLEASHPSSFVVTKLSK